MSLKTFKFFKMMFLMALTKLRSQRYIVTHWKICFFSNFLMKNPFLKLCNLIESISIKVKYCFLLQHCHFLWFLVFSNISLHCDAFVKSCFPGIKSVHNAENSLILRCNRFLKSYLSICFVNHSSLKKSMPWKP